eukprot:CAMPEP_0179247766 /NCGR_PEP_ID=MMETSP0797-20121207/19781_1 /TAXON_ID=47934 /ORGANISM="Dinophysis acuminata, Strain DAEP01" /LENGTH=65 /DNA_ID=CAMNT_0020955401 /DNA_START=64 /DNA_END=258 /DNA_ORIENTATION=+
MPWIPDEQWNQQQQQKGKASKGVISLMGKGSQGKGWQPEGGKSKGWQPEGGKGKGWQPAWQPAWQ